MTIPTPVTHSRKTDVPLKGVLYGDPFTGKTTLASTLVQLGDLLFLNLEGGMLSIPANDKILTITITGDKPIDVMDETLWALSARDLKANPWIESVKSIVLDSGSEYANIALEQIVRYEASKPGTKRKDANDVYLEDYGTLTTILTRQFRHLRDLPYNVIVTALPKRTYPPIKDKSQKPELIGLEPIDVRPQFTSKLGNSIIGFFDHVWYTYTTDGEEGKSYRILTLPQGPYIAKTRGTTFPSKLGRVVNNPTLPTIYNLLQETERKS